VQDIEHRALFVAIETVDVRTGAYDFEIQEVVLVTKK
jgi:hypothetical protein